MFVVGAGAYTLISFIAKYLRDPKTAFNLLFLFTSLLSMFLVILLSPTFLIPGILPFSVAGFQGTLFIVFACFSMGFAGNFLLNLPVTFLLKQLSEANVSITAGLKPKPRYLLYMIVTIGLIGLILGASVNAIAQYEASIHTTGTIAGVRCKLYSNAALTNEMTTIEWGVREPGSTKNVDMWVVNTGNVPATLYYLTSNWNPSLAQTYMTLSWSYNQETIQPGNSLKVTLTLDVDETITGITNFSFDITVVASG